VQGSLCLDQIGLHRAENFSFCRKTVPLDDDGVDDNDMMIIVVENLVITIRSLSWQVMLLVLTVLGAWRL
jgi:hypothetical protein